LEFGVSFIYRTTGKNSRLLSKILPAGYALQGETVPESQLQPYIQDAINEIQFVTGDAKTNQWAKLRAQYGRTAPYKLKYIEIGNEDFFVSTANLCFKSF
jgi:alpha-L-arabinofuranosidase